MKDKYSRGICTDLNDKILDLWWNDDESYKELIKEQENIEKDKIEHIENLEAWNQFNLQSFQLDLIHYQQTKDQLFFEDNIYNQLKQITYILSKFYISKIPMKARQLFLAESNSNDYSEFIHEIMWYAVNNWKPNTVGKHEGSVSFKGYYEMLVKRYYISILRKFNRSYMKNISIDLVNFSDGENSMINKIELEQLNGLDLLNIEDEFKLDGLDKYYKINTSKKYVFAKHFINFVYVLTKPEASLLYMLIEGNLNNKQMAIFLKVHEKTIPNMKKRLQSKWIKFNEGIEI